ncbi:Ribosome biogenesis protein NOC1 like [Verticillium longisporum]|uniref:Ribosome biogenesis protein NOC1 like n=1 Tax=Verticillium longisporum TaxID=100787 RepID=A0A8I3AP59_VERLO|nr:Ribosome biogenesis protein NOC1 like [Verticillium longisporum]
MSGAKGPRAADKKPQPQQSAGRAYSDTTSPNDRQPPKSGKASKRKHQQDDKASNPVTKRKRPTTQQSSSTKPVDAEGNGGATQRPDASNLQSALLDEILALGGNEEDLELIGDLESESETEGLALDNRLTDDSKLREDLRALASQLGLEGLDATVDEEEVSEVEEARQDFKPGESQDETQAASSTTVSSRETHVSATKDNGLRKQFKFEPRADWHAVELSPLPEPISDEIDPYIGAVESLKAHARVLLDDDANAYSKSVLASSSHKFLSTIMASGTLTDKVSALTLAIQESPLHNIKAFDALMSLASKRSRGQAIGALGALVDLLGPGLILPSSRRLRTFHSQRGLLGILQKHNMRRWTMSQQLPGALTEAHLIGWAYEDWLKATYFQIIQYLEVWCGDEIEYSRTRSLDFVFALLKDKPEQETNLLRLLVNKLGDRDRKISSRASYLLLQLQNSHPGMKLVVIRAVEQEVLLRPGQSSRAKYYAVGTLNQTILSTRDPKTAEALLSCYFEIFVTLLKGSVLGREDAPKDDSTSGVRGRSQRGKSKTVTPPTERDAVEKLVSAVLTGINRAAPFLPANDPIMEAHIDTLFRIAHSANFNTNLRALLEDAEEHGDAEFAASVTSGNLSNVVTSTTDYDGRKRDPEHSNAQNSCLWEIAPLLWHFHPSVPVLALSVIDSDQTVQKPDLESHSLIRFLDKFVYRNPKATEANRGVSIMQPLQGSSDASNIYLGKKHGASTTPINHPNFWNKKIEQVAADDVFFHHYFEHTGKQSKPQAPSRVEPLGDSDNEDEDEIWKALTASHPDGPVDESDGSDLDLDGFDDDSDDAQGASDLFADESLSEGDDEIEGESDIDTDDDDVNGGVEMLGPVSQASDEDNNADVDASDKKRESETRSARRKRLKSLPMFASVDDYAEMLGEEEDM